MKDDSRGTLRSQMPSIDVPPALDARIRKSLMDSGSIVETRSTRRFGSAIVLFATAASFLVTGILIGRSFFDGTTIASSASRYALLLYGADTPEGDVSRRREYGDWLEAVARGSTSFTGEELGREVMRLGPPIAASKDDGPLLGFFIIGAASERDAVEMAKSSPHLRHGGAIVVQEVVK